MSQAKFVFGGEFLRLCNKKGAANSYTGFIFLGEKNGQKSPYFKEMFFKKIYLFFKT